MCAGATGRRLGFSTKARSPPWLAIIRVNFAHAAPLSRASRSNARADSSLGRSLARCTSCAPRVMHNSTRSAGPPPRSAPIASRTSRALPMANPRGCCIELRTADTWRPAWRPIATIARASVRASSIVCINAPLPYFTSRTMQSAPAASFLLMMLAAMSGIDSTVAVTSRSA